VMGVGGGDRGMCGQDAHTTFYGDVRAGCLHHVLWMMRGQDAHTT